MSKHEEKPAAELSPVESTLLRAITAIADRLERLEQRPAMPTNPHDGKTPDQLHAEMMAEIRGSDDDVARFELVEVVERVTSDTGAVDAEGEMRGSTFDAVICFRPVIVKGRLAGRDPKKFRVTEMRNYTWPEGVDKHIAQGGLVPDGMDMHDAKDPSKESSQYKQWKWETFLQADTRRFVGRPLPAHIRATSKPREAEPVEATG